MESDIRLKKLLDPLQGGRCSTTRRARGLSATAELLVNTEFRMAVCKDQSERGS